MALELKFTNEEQDGCKEIHFTEETGTYNVSTNPGGYDSPNMDSNLVIKAEIVVLPHGDTIGYTFTFTILNKVITAATVTDPSGTVTNILADLTSNVWPFIVGVNPFIIKGDYLGFGTDSEIESNGYNISYEVTDNPGNVEITDQDELWVCQVCCCVRSAFSALKATACDCQRDALSQAQDSQAFLDAAIWSTEAGEIDKGVELLAMAKRLCEGNCTNC